MLSPKKRKLGALFNDILLNFGLSLPAVLSTLNLYQHLLFGYPVS